MFADLHTHLLPAVDDGSPDVATSVAWISELAAQGVSEIAVTPHIHWYFDAVLAPPEHSAHVASRGWGQGGADPTAFVPSGFAALAQAVRDANVPVKLHQGGELHPSVAERQSAEALATIALGPEGKQFVLLEVDLFSDFDERWSQAAAYVRSMGYDVLVGHPERAGNMHTSEAQARLRDEIAGGVRVQVNVGSLLFDGSQHQRLGLELIHDGLVTCVASDVHPPSRPQMISQLLEAGGRLGLSDTDVRRLIGDGPISLLHNGF